MATTIISEGGKPVAVHLRHLRFDVTGGPDAGTTAMMTKRELSAGSHPSNDLVLADQAVSRFHFRVHASDAGYRILDPTSTNGTTVDGVRVHDAFLHDGCRIGAGSTTITVRFEATESSIELSSEHWFGGAVGRSVAMRELFATARKVAATNATVLLLGETGTGKDVVARALHDHSTRAGGPYIVLDCGATPANLIESTLFGHARGAFTGADVAHTGVFERASGGTLFLDEIGELPVALQPKLLRVLETGSVTPVGATSPIAVDVRIIAATNRDLRHMVEIDAFRSDLYYRIAVVPLELPPLRERSEDIPLLAGTFLRDMLGRDPGWMPAHLVEAFGRLGDYRWPGNVRELRNVIERAVAMADPGVLAQSALAQLVELRASVARTMAAPPPLQDARAHADREYLRDLLARCQGDIARAAHVADIHPKSLERLLRRYRIPKP